MISTCLLVFSTDMCKKLRTPNPESMSELLDVLDDARVLDRETRLR